MPVFMNWNKQPGLTNLGLYAEFKDKEDLFVQSLRYYLESLEEKGLLTAEPLGWNNIERFLKIGPSSLAGQKGCFAVNSMRESAIAAGSDRSRHSKPQQPKATLGQEY